MKYKRSVYKSFAMITQFSLNMIIPILLCSLIGVWIDKKFGTWFVIPLFFLGAMAGFRNIYIMAKGIYNDDKDSGHDKKM